MPLFELSNNLRDAWPSGARDFDFLEGEWIIRHRRLRERLKGSNDWVEFETPMVMQACGASIGSIYERASFPPVVGGFDGSDGVFRGEDSHDGQPVLVTFRWNRRDPSRPIWQQAFSADGGHSWETNWFMYFRRP